MIIIENAHNTHKKNEEFFAGSGLSGCKFFLQIEYQGNRRENGASSTQRKFPRNPIFEI
jgi:hypothetical protein